MRGTRKGYLHTWNFVDGYYGVPNRKIALQGVSARLLECAYLGGGERWDHQGTPPGAVLRLLLTASHRAQSSRAYYGYYEHYDITRCCAGLEAKHSEMSGGDRATWQIELSCLGWSQEQIDSTIATILAQHLLEIERVAKLLRDEAEPD